MNIKADNFLQTDLYTLGLSEEACILLYHLGIETGLDLIMADKEILFQNEKYKKIKEEVENFLKAHGLSLESQISNKIEDYSSDDITYQTFIKKFKKAKTLQDLKDICFDYKSFLSGMGAREEFASKYYGFEKEAGQSVTYVFTRENKVIILDYKNVLEALYYFNVKALEEAQNLFEEPKTLKKTRKN